MSWAIIEMQKFLEEEILPRDSKHSFLWWQEHKQIYSYLSKIAQKRLCTLATSVPCERLFSKAGQVLTERRNKKFKLFYFYMQISSSSMSVIDIQSGPKVWKRPIIS
ncbi:unnamed protein product [Psylliodes chrysocephalus]|uniref:HAT C-terminal dimerisation domain-containing protein n=1 Tax=Psylliodes chrysocephalus TaxID=3402493 RepID=A0A9P0GDD0_9CUCU|nr:unnamed protein product [Psylliodes chrysocephala]